MSRTLKWTGAQDDNAANAQNWNDLTDMLNPAAAPPTSGDTAIITFGTVDADRYPDRPRQHDRDGGTAGAATLVFTSAGGTGVTIPSVGDASPIDNRCRARRRMSRPCWRRTEHS